MINVIITHKQKDIFHQEKKVINVKFVKILLTQQKTYENATFMMVMESLDFVDNDENTLTRDLVYAVDLDT